MSLRPNSEDMNFEIFCNLFFKEARWDVRLELFQQFESNKVILTGMTIKVQLELFWMTNFIIYNFVHYQRRK
jgi:hypothetical protein